MKYYTYIIQSRKDGSFYVGFTSQLDERIRKHNRPHKGYTARKQPWVLRWAKECSSKKQAIALERKIKKLKSAKAIRKIIQNQLDV